LKLRVFLGGDFMNTIVSPPTLQGTSADFSYCRAALYSALAVGFHTPGQEVIGRLLSPEGVDVLACAAAVVDDQNNLASRVLKLAAVKESSLWLLVASYQRLFGHTAHGVVSPYETEYGNEALFQQPQEMGDLAGFYRAFGLRLNTAEHERLDHISCECEFMLFLVLKEAYALEHNDTVMLQETRRASRLFLRDHLGRFGLTFARKLAREDQGGFYGALGDLCFAFLGCECERVGVTAGPVDLGLRPATDDRIPMACGSGTECVAMPGACGSKEIEE
jgi:putative dimethyl sulfoxide reductase chaperone